MPLDPAQRHQIEQDASHATGSTLFILQVCRSVAMVAHVRPRREFSSPAFRQLQGLMLRTPGDDREMVDSLALVASQ